MGDESEEKEQGKEEEGRDCFMTDYKNYK